MSGHHLKNLALICIFIVIGSSFLVPGCGNGAAPSGIEQNSEEGNQAVTETKPVETQDADSASSSMTIHMCGRSVLAGWFYYWGWEGDPATPIGFGGYNLIYHEMNSPPDITASALDVLHQMKLRGDKIMFFKLCFVDFIGGDQDGARQNLEADKEIIRTVVKAAVEDAGLTLIPGNALPTPSP